MKTTTPLFTALDSSAGDFESSNIDRIEYSEMCQTVTVRFKSGAVHSYFEVPPSLAKRFVKADSKGEFYNAKIKGKFSSHHHVI